MNRETKDPRRQNARHIIRLNNLRRVVRHVLRRRDVPKHIRAILDAALVAARADFRLTRKDLQ